MSDEEIRALYRAYLAEGTYSAYRAYARQAARVGSPDPLRFLSALGRIAGARRRIDRLALLANHEEELGERLAQIEELRDRVYAFLAPIEARARRLLRSLVARAKLPGLPLSNAPRGVEEALRETTSRLLPIRRRERAAKRQARRLPRIASQLCRLCGETSGIDGLCLPCRVSLGGGSRRDESNLWPGS